MYGKRYGKTRTCMKRRRGEQAEMYSKTHTCMKRRRGEQAEMYGKMNGKTCMARHIHVRTVCQDV